MGNKQQLRTNNSGLSTALTNIQGLPIIDDVKHGLYAWKKYEYGNLVLKHPAIKLKQSAESSTGNFYWNIEGLSDDIKRIVGADFFDGFTTNSFRFVYGVNGLKCVPNNAEYSAISDVTTYDSTTMKLHTRGNLSSSWGGSDLEFTCDGEKEVDGIKAAGKFINYTVSDNPTKYPENGVQDGYWYEKMVKSADYGEFTLADSSQTDVVIEHGLGSIPRHAAVIPKSVSYSKNDYAVCLGLYRLSVSGMGGATVWNYSLSGGYYLASGWAGGSSCRGSSSATNETATFSTGNSNYFWKKGSYIWIAIA